MIPLNRKLIDRTQRTLFVALCTYSFIFGDTWALSFALEFIDEFPIWYSIAFLLLHGDSFGFLLDATFRGSCGGIYQIVALLICLYRTKCLRFLYLNVLRLHIPRLIFNRMCKYYFANYSVETDTLILNYIKGEHFDSDIFDKIMDILTNSPTRTQTTVISSYLITVKNHLSKEQLGKIEELAKSAYMTEDRTVYDEIIRVLKHKPARKP